MSIYIFHNEIDRHSLPFFFRSSSLFSLSRARRFLSRFVGFFESSLLLISLEILEINKRGIASFLPLSFLVAYRSVFSLFSLFLSMKDSPPSVHALKQGKERGRADNAFPSTPIATSLLHPVSFEAPQESKHPLSQSSRLTTCHRRHQHVIIGTST